MAITVNLNWVLRKIVGGQAAIELEGCETTGQCLDKLVERYPALRNEIGDSKQGVPNDYVLCVNDKPALPNELTTPVKDGDRLEFMIAIDGG